MGNIGPTKYTGDLRKWLIKKSLLVKRIFWVCKENLLTEKKTTEKFSWGIHLSFKNLLFLVCKRFLLTKRRNKGVNILHLYIKRTSLPMKIKRNRKFSDTILIEENLGSARTLNFYFSFTSILRVSLVSKKRLLLFLFWYFLSLKTQRTIRSYFTHKGKFYRRA